MIISDKIVASYVEGFSGVYINCEQSIVGEIADAFEEVFASKWNEAMDDAEEEYDCPCVEKEEEMDAPVQVHKQENRVYVDVYPLFLTFGSRADNQYGPDALEDTLKELKEKYPSISYEGVIAYEWCDEHSSDVVNEEISSEETDAENKKTYDFIKEKLNMVINEEPLSEEFWEKMGWQIEEADEDDVNQIINDFRTYGVTEDAVDQLMELADEYEIFEEEE